MKRGLRNLLVLATLAQGVPAVAQDGLSGSYLAARQASFYADYEEASQYFDEALQRDPSNPALLEGALIAAVGLSDFESAVPLAARLREIDPINQLANMVALAEFGVNEDFQGILTAYEGDFTIGPLVDGLAVAWANVGLGQMTQAFEAFDAVRDASGTRSFGLFHKAMALALVGDYEGADSILSGEGDGPLQATVSGVITHAQVLSHLDRHESALELLDSVFGNSVDPTISALRAQLEAKDVIPLSITNSAGDGLAEVFYSIANILQGEAEDAFALNYARVAERLNPEHVQALLLSASLLENLERYELAAATYDRVPRDDPSFHLAEIGRADTLRMSGKSESALEVLTQLTESHGHIPMVHSRKGDTLRAMERYTEARTSYTRAIELESDEERHGLWVTYYSRGITYERDGLYEEMERDFRHALEINPGQPLVLNYLGYSLVEQRQKLDEALEMIEQAVDARPDSGFIIDSLGWALYRLGRYDEAIGHMERAAAIESADPIVSDHLGDVLWAVGRYREAEFQWRRALSFIDPEEENSESDPDRIRRKLEVGLDQVLEEEGSDPLAVAGDGG